MEGKFSFDLEASIFKQIRNIFVTLLARKRENFKYTTQRYKSDLIVRRQRELKSEPSVTSGREINSRLTNGRWSEGITNSLTRGGDKVPSDFHIGPICGAHQHPALTRPLLFPFPASNRG